MTGPERLDFWEMPDRTDLLSSRERDREDYDSCLRRTSEWMRLSRSWKDWLLSLRASEKVRWDIVYYKLWETIKGMIFAKKIIHNKS